MEPLVSIITPAYNQEKFIAECIESVLKQTFVNWEMLIIDDHSDDDTPRIIENYAKKDKRIKFIRHSYNWGFYRLVDTNNQALSLSAGDYIAMLDGDDFWPEDKLEKQMPYFNDPEVILTYGKRIIVSSSEGTTLNIGQSPQSYHELFDDYKGFVYIPLLLGNFISTVTAIIRKSALLQIGNFQTAPDIPCYDYPTWLKLAFAGKFFGSKEILGFYRKHHRSHILHNAVEFNRGAKKLAFYMLNKINKAPGPLISYLPLRIKMEKRWTRSIIRACWTEGRFFKSRFKQRKALSLFLNGLKEGSPLFLFVPGIWLEKAKCIFGILSVLLNINLEKVINLLRRRKVSIFEAVKNS